MSYALCLLDDEGGMQYSDRIQVDWMFRSLMSASP